MPESYNIVDKFKGIRQWVHIFKQKDTYLYLLKNTNLIPEQEKKVAALKRCLDLLQRELADEVTKLQNQRDAIPTLEKWLEEHKSEYEVKEQFASDAVQKLAEKVQKEQDAAASD